MTRKFGEDPDAFTTSQRAGRVINRRVLTDDGIKKTKRIPVLQRRVIFAHHAETRVPTNGNSGIYLRSTDEVQIFDSYGKPLDPHNMGAIYSRITPTAAAEKPAGEWQTVDTFCMWPNTRP